MFNTQVLFTFPELGSKVLSNPLKGVIRQRKNLYGPPNQVLDRLQSVYPYFKGD
jgi:hypothetical protein